MMNEPAFQGDIKKGCIRIAAILLFLIVLPGLKLYSQVTIGYYKGTDCTFNTITDINTGCTSTNYFTLQYSGFVNGTTYPAGWTLKVRANGNFTNGSTTIAPQYVSIGFNSASGGPSGVTGTGFQTLSTVSDVSLITTSASLKTPPVYYFEHKLNLKVQGGSHLTVGTGTYSTTLTVTLVNANGVTIATKNNVQASFVVNYSNSCSGATLGSYFSNQYTFTTYAQQMGGATATHAITVQYNPHAATCTGWSLKVRATGNFTNGANFVAPQYISLRFNRVSSGSPTAAAIGVTNNPVALNTSDVTLINQSNAPFVANSATEHKFDMVIQGGNHMLVPNGTYSGNLTFTLYNQANQVVSTTNVTATFAVNSTANSYTLVLQNTANDIDLVFNTIAHYINGVAVIKTKGLKITGYNPYQVLVKTSAANLVSTTSSNTIPVSAVTLETTKNTTTAAGIVTYTRELSTADQLIISNPLSDYTQQIVEFDLKYFTQPGDRRFSLPGGSFNTNVLFVVIPQ